MPTKPTLRDLLRATDARKRGVEHHSAKLTPARVAVIRKALAAGVAPASIARLEGVSRQAIQDIKDGRTWKKS
jgi:hypothetical protein